MITKSNIFTYGEVGERLSGIRESEIYQQSAQRIENLIITEMGNLKIAKDFNYQAGDYDFKQVIDTRYNFYICCYANKITTWSKNGEELGEPLYEYEIEVPNVRIFKLCDDKLFVIGDTTEVFEFEKNTGRIGKSNFLDLFLFPIKDKKIIVMDLYKIYQVKNEIRVSFLGKYETPKLKISNGNIYMSETNIKIDRIYKQYKTSISEKNLTNIKPNMVFGVFRNYKKPEKENKFLIGNTEIEFTNEVSDSVYGGTYFTKANKNIDGDLSYGEILRITDKITTVGLYQDRLVLVNDGKFYFSKKSNYVDFRNDTKIDSSFFFKVTPINNIYPKIYDMYIGDKIYVVTSKGIYVISTNNILASNSYSVFIASELGAHINSKYSYEGNCELINNTFFYLTDNNELRSVEQTPSTQGLESYSSTKVEKYDLYTKFNKVGKLKYDNKIYIVVYKSQKEILYMYEQLEYKLFRRTSLKIKKSKDIIFFNSNIVLQGDICYLLTQSTNNTNRAILRVNPPYMETNKGHYNNDYSSRVMRVFIKVLNEDKAAINGIKINNQLIRKNAIEDDLFSVFKLETSFPVLNGFDIEIITKQNTKIFEILGIDCEIEVVGD